jgi:hypothetical protein
MILSELAAIIAQRTHQRLVRRILSSWRASGLGWCQPWGTYTMATLSWSVRVGRNATSPYLASSSTPLSLGQTKISAPIHETSSATSKCAETPVLFPSFSRRTCRRFTPLTSILHCPRRAREAALRSPPARAFPRRGDRGLQTIQHVQPDVAFFGQKDFQQCAVVHRMTLDLNLPIEIVTVPTVRSQMGSR